MHTSLLLTSHWLEPNHMVFLQRKLGNGIFSWIDMYPAKTEGCQLLKGNTGKWIWAED
jgi:hypothetical protein